MISFRYIVPFGKRLETAKILNKTHFLRKLRNRFMNLYSYPYIPSQMHIALMQTLVSFFMVPYFVFSLWCLCQEVWDCVCSMKVHVGYRLVWRMEERLGWKISPICSMGGGRGLPDLEKVRDVPRILNYNFCAFLNHFH